MELPALKRASIGVASLGVCQGERLGWDNVGSCRRGKLGQVGNHNVYESWEGEDGDVSNLCFEKMGWVRAWIQDLFCQREEGGVGDDM